MSVPTPAASYLFEFRPAVGKGRDRQSVKLVRFGTDAEAIDHAASLLKTFPVQAIRVLRVGPDGESVPVATVPEPNNPSQQRP